MNLKCNTNNMKHTILFYNDQVELYSRFNSENKDVDVTDFIDKNPKNISWSSSLVPQVKKGRKTKFDSDFIYKCIYRPFCRMNIYYGELFIHRRGQFGSIFPSKKIKTKVILISGIGGHKQSSVLIADSFIDLNSLEDYLKENNKKVCCVFVTSLIGFNPDIEKLKQI